MMTEQLKLDNNLSMRSYCFKLYTTFVENKELGYNDFMKVLKNNFKNIDIPKLKFYIGFIKKDISVKKSEDMILILKYIKAREKNDVEQIELLKKNIDQIDMRTANEVQTIGRISVSKELKEKQENHHTNLIDTLNKDMDCVINENKSHNELMKEGKIQTTLLLTYSRKYVKELDLDKYIKFLVSNYGLSTTSNKDLKEYNEIVEFFINNIDSTIEILREYYRAANESGVRKVYVKGQENLDSNYSSISKLYNWKLKKLQLLRRNYQKLYNSVDSLIDNKLEEFDRESTEFLRFLKDEEACIEDFYKNLIKIQRVYNEQIVSNMFATDSLKNTLKDKYVKVLLPGNNK